MKTWAAHLQPEREPVLVRDGFAWGAMLFGPFWLLAHRAWVPATLSLATYAMVQALMPPVVCVVLIPAIMLLHGQNGSDMIGWGLERRGYLLAHVIAARSEAEAFVRLLTERPDQIAWLQPSERAR